MPSEPISVPSLGYPLSCTSGSSFSYVLLYFLFVCCLNWISAIIFITYFYFFFLPAALIESFNGDAESVSDVPPSTRHSASLSLPLILQPGISEPPQPLLPASAPSAPLPAPSLGTGSQQAAFGNPPALLQPPEVPVAHSTQFAANHQEFLPHIQAPQPIVPGLSVVAGALASAAAVASAMAAPPQPQSTTEPLPAMVQTEEPAPRVLLQPRK